MNSKTVKHVWELSIANMNVITELLDSIEDKDDSVKVFEDEFYRFMKATNVLYAENIFKKTFRTETIHKNITKKEA